MKKIGICLFAVAMAALAAPTGPTRGPANSASIRVADGGYPPPPPCTGKTCTVLSIPSAPALSTASMQQFADGGYPPPPPCTGKTCTVLSIPSTPALSIPSMQEFADGGYPPPPPCTGKTCTLRYDG